jgi:hypothetical protein
MKKYIVLILGLAILGVSCSSSMYEAMEPGMEGYLSESDIAPSMAPSMSRSEASGMKNISEDQNSTASRTDRLRIYTGRLELNSNRVEEVKDQIATRTIAIGGRVERIYENGMVILVPAEHFLNPWNISKVWLNYWTELLRPMT